MGADEETMEDKYKTEDDIISLVRAFEDTSIARGGWKHREHLVVALYYLNSFDIEAATEKMRSGILNLLERGFNVDLAKEMPYHETITIFWMRAVHRFLAETNGSSLVRKVAEMSARFNKDYPLRFYSRELLFSDEARARFVEPDIVPFD